jgi:chitinase
VLASPETLQVTLDKRDGSHWELFDCNDAVTEDHPDGVHRPVAI